MESEEDVGDRGDLNVQVGEKPIKAQVHLPLTWQDPTFTLTLMHNVLTLHVSFHVFDIFLTGKKHRELRANTKANNKLVQYSSGVMKPWHIVRICKGYGSVDRGERLYFLLSEIDTLPKTTVECGKPFKKGSWVFNLRALVGWHLHCEPPSAERMHQLVVLYPF